MEEVTGHRIIAAAGKDRVVAVSAIDVVAAGITGDEIVAKRAKDKIAAITTLDDAVSETAIYGIETTEVDS